MVEFPTNGAYPLHTFKNLHRINPSTGEIIETLENKQLESIYAWTPDDDRRLPEATKNMADDQCVISDANTGAVYLCDIREFGAAGGTLLAHA